MSENDNGNNNDKEIFDVIGVTISKNKTISSDGVKSVSQGSTQAKQFDGKDNTSIQKAMSLFLKEGTVLHNQIDVTTYPKEGVNPDSDSKTFIGTYQKADPVDGDPDKVEVSSYVVSIIAKPLKPITSDESESNDIAENSTSEEDNPEL